MTRLAAAFLLACTVVPLSGPAVSASSSAYRTIGHIERYSPALDALIGRDARIEKLADGFTWTEGPAWVRNGGYLLFSDVPQNKMYQWSPGRGASLFLSPSGFAGPDFSPFREAGSNGLIPGPGNSILMADSGSRAVARLDLSSKQKTFLATRYQGKRFNSPNDLVRAADGTIYFTDPPYGLKDLAASPVKELPFSGVFRLATDGTVTLVDDSLAFPNGILLSPDGRTLYVSNSDPKRAIWMAYSLAVDGRVASRRVFADMTALVSEARPGLPDGMAIDRRGNLFASGPGGIYIFTPQGRKLGLIATGKAIANCTFGGADGRLLYLTSSDTIARLPTRTRGLGF